MGAARSAADLRRLCAAAEDAFAHGTLWQTRKDCRQIPLAGTYHLADSGLGAITATRAPHLEHATLHAAVKRDPSLANPHPQASSGRANVTNPVSAG
ncbi:MAG: hypothetical protein WCO04_10250 [Pseudomonadota bacterium]